MKERPILFQGAMVRALLAGTKTQTRRAVKPQALSGQHDIAAVVSTSDSMAAFVRQRCPYGQPGDRLWVREAHWWPKDEHDPVTGYFPPKLTTEDVAYRADGDDGRKVWRPSIHMPRWASRILLEVTAVRVERLQAISDADAQAEGCPCYVCSRIMDGRSEDDCHCFHRTADASDYRNLWESINGAGSWDANPWVWVVEFKRVP